MTTNNSNVIPVVTKDHNGALRASVYANKTGIVLRTEALEYDTGLAVKLMVGEVNQGDFVVRSVRAGKRRKIEVLAGVVPVELARQVPGFADVHDNKFVDEGGNTARTEFGTGDCIVLDNGDNVAEMAGAVRIEA